MHVDVDDDAYIVSKFVNAMAAASVALDIPNVILLYKYIYIFIYICMLLCTGSLAQSYTIHIVQPTNTYIPTHIYITHTHPQLWP